MVNRVRLAGCSPRAGTSFKVVHHIHGAMEQTRLKMPSEFDALRSTPYSFGLLALVSASFFLVFWDIYNIGFVLPLASRQLGVSTSSLLYGLPISSGLIGYVAGEICFGMMSQRVGRRRVFVATLLTLAVGSFLSAFSQDFLELSIFRFVVGVGIGAEIAVIPAYMSEITPAGQRGTYASLVAASGTFAIIPVGLISLYYLGSSPIIWRFLLGIPGLIALPLLFLRLVYLPESPRWLLDHGNAKGAQAVLARFGVVSVPDREVGVPGGIGDAHPYVGRTFLFFVVWTLFYFGDYAAFSVGPSLMYIHGVPESSIFLYFLVALLGGALGAVAGVWAADRIERKKLGLAAMACMSLFLLFWGFDVGSPAVQLAWGFGTFAMGGLWIPVIYAYTAENFPTRSRTSRMGFTDGLGHVGGAAAPYVVIPISISAGLFGMGGFVSAFILMAVSQLLAGALLFLFGSNANGRRLEEISP